MKINNNCARKILIEVEKIQSDDRLTVEKLQERLSEFAIEDVMYIVNFFHKEHYLSILDKVSYDDCDVLRDHKIKGLTEKGYKTLDVVRDDAIWNLMREKIDNFDELSIFTIFNIANKISNVKYNELFDLPRDMITDIRW